MKTITYYFLLLFLASSFSQCSSTKNLSRNKTMQEKAPFKINNSESYYQYWVAGVKGGGSGITIVLNLYDFEDKVVLDSVYFDKYTSKLEFRNDVYVGNITRAANQKQDIILSSEKNAEFNNQLPSKKELVFDLKENECVVSYTQNNATKYYKITNLNKKANPEYPSVKPRE